MLANCLQIQHNRSNKYLLWVKTIIAVNFIPDGQDHSSDGLRLLPGFTATVVSVVNQASKAYHIQASFVHSKSMFTLLAEKRTNLLFRGFSSSKELKTFLA
ncbi:hypothetical protein AVEN_1807-1 [Araneus ventricosus]|uniref:Uncharacterized protein n=1 Tax=Araneus ventricosus TaxID=182803 RepID=A0A4Y2HY56_ARAVE|nr:hypothetical protein AVEN_1807-1 [Araneus ventricosus]